MQSQAFKINTSTLWVATLLCDVLITVSMVILLRRARSTTVYTSSQSVLDGLVVHTIENGLITTTCAILVFITFYVLPNTFFFVCL